MNGTGEVLDPEAIEGCRRAVRSHRLEFAVRFHLRRFARYEKQIRNAFMATQHAREDRGEPRI
jgi:hypothetical protein